MDLSFPILEIFVPLICLSVVVLCCNTSCRAIQRAREERRAQNAREADRPSIFIIPFPPSRPSDDDLYRPPRYSETRSYSPPPPPYDEVEMKPEFFMSPDAPPPPYAPPFPRPSSPSVTGS
ncbi:transmembrane protein 92 [Clupea harengus]|uniref:Transmembrane protein 92 n=1 Tax=Clupea harengus TaxID=7950 RepID=A0A6P8F751_CLUHA|nr:transmembrane protein 92 [Clupea harengus]